ncbi:MAG: hypothetical protein CMJ40_04590 [Phycisphaerae bacterium]|nr:hypothetical protein [Phycisphaerae bacterium]
MKSMIMAFLLMTMLIPMAFSDEHVRYIERLERLSPEDPAGYFELAEDVVDAGTSPADVALAIRLYVLADHLNPVMYRRSSILGIQPLVDDPSVRRLLQANLRAATPYSSYMPAEGHWSTRDDEMVLNAVDAISAFRNGDEKKFLRLVDSTEVIDILEANADRLPGDVDWMRRRIEQKQSKGVELSEDDQVSTLEFQAELLGSDDQPWSVVLRTGEGRPLTVIEPIPLADIFGISADRARWIDGDWSP